MSSCEMEMEEPKLVHSPENFQWHEDVPVINHASHVGSWHSRLGLKEIRILLSLQLVEQEVLKWHQDLLILQQWADERKQNKFTELTKHKLITNK